MENSSIIIHFFPSTKFNASKSKKIVDRKYSHGQILTLKTNPVKCGYSGSTSPISLLCVPGRTAYSRKFSRNSSTYQIENIKTLEFAARQYILSYITNSTYKIGDCQSGLNKPSAICAASTIKLNLWSKEHQCNKLHLLAIQFVSRLFMWKQTGASAQLMLVNFWVY